MTGGKKPPFDPRGRRRGPKVKVKAGKGRSTSSRRWLERHLNDPYVAEARRLGYRSRAAFKLRELDARFALLKDARRILDLGAAPGGWTQVAVASCPRAHIVALDILPMEPVAGAAVLCADFLAENTETILIEALSGPADLVLSDMAPASTGHKATDALRTMALCEAALDFAEKVLRPGGHFVAKVMRGGTDHVLLARMRQVFAEVKHAKPPSSRAESSEWFVIAKGYRREDKAPLE